MKIDGTRPAKGVVTVEKAPAVERTTQTKAVADRVSVDEGTKLADQVQVARLRAGGARAARLSQIEAAVRGGHFRPDPGQIAEQILNAAEVDAKLQAMLGR
jgi:anti-sigma28 factor (negative regulator of flagellin synthesis)